MKNRAYLFIILGASMWGVISIFLHGLYSYGFTPIQVVAIRVVLTAILLVSYVALTRRSLLKIQPVDVKYFIGTGIISVVFFNWCYFTAVQETSISIAAILLYTAPAFVTVLSRLLFNEWLTQKKIIAVIVTFFGCSFVVGLIPGTHQNISGFGILVGLGSGFGYALYSIFGKFALDKYHAITVTTYTFVIAGIGIIPVSGLWKVITLFHHWQVWGYSLGLSLLSTVFAYLLYTIGLVYVESSRASIMATIEPLVATLVGVFLFSEKLTVWQFVGIFLILYAVVIVQEKRRIHNVSTETIMKIGGNE